MGMGSSQGTGEHARRRNLLRKLIPVALRTRLRQLTSPSFLPRAAREIIQSIQTIQPEVVHAMRIPYEGMAAGQALTLLKRRGGSSMIPPLMVSVWGNDFTLHASSTPQMARLTRQAMQVADALHTDCQRDVNLAREWGFSASKPAIVLPGGGGVKLDVFSPRLKAGDQAEARLVNIINPRGIRAYVRNDTFFHAIPLVLEKLPQARFICPGMAGEAQAEKWLREIGSPRQVELLPSQSPEQMATAFRLAEISLSITEHDGTPNTLLEAMASGCLPIAGDLESIREWIIPGINGILVDPADPNRLAEAILGAAAQPEFRERAREYNLKLIKERAEYGRTMRSAQDFYLALVQH